MKLGQFFYFWGVLLIVPVWVAMFALRPRSRREMLYMGTLFGVAAVVIAQIYALADYWNPPYIFGPVFNIEDFLYGFFYGGIAAELLEAVTGREDSDQKMKKRSWLVVLMFFVTLVSFVLLVDQLRLNSIFAHIISPIVAGTCIVLTRRDLAGAALQSGLILVVFTSVWYLVILSMYPHAIEQSWMLENLSGILLIGIPIEEYIFAFSLGFGGSVFYEAVTGKRLRKVVVQDVQNRHIP